MKFEMKQNEDNTYSVEELTAIDVEGRRGLVGLAVVHVNLEGVVKDRRVGGFLQHLFDLCQVRTLSRIYSINHQLTNN
jgi:hypothetical protein